MATEMMKELGLEHSVMSANEGNLPAEKFAAILLALRNDKIPDDTKDKITTMFASWIKVSGTGAGNGDVLIRANASKIFELVEFFGKQPDDGTAENYNGIQKWAHTVVDGLSTFGMMKQDFLSTAAPMAYDVLGRLIAVGNIPKDAGVYVKTQAATERCALYKCLLRFLPFSGTVDIPAGATIIADIICNEKFPKSLKDGAKQALSSMARVNKKALEHSGVAIMNIIASGGNDDLIFTFLSMPELYTNSPECLHDHLPLVLGMNWMNVCSLINNVASKHAEKLVPHVHTLMSKLSEAPTMGPVTLGILKEVSKVDPAAIYPLVDQIIAAGKGLSNSSYAVAGCVAHAALTTSPKNAADNLLPKLIEVIKSSDAAFLPACLSELSNMKEALSDRKLLEPHMDYICSLRSGSAVMVGMLEDYVAGRSLLVVTQRVDAIEAKISELNNKVAESCSSFEDVMAYVDANMADMKDFLGDVVKKLPTPKRLEVVGTLRKTLILHFECVHTGREFPIISKEWSKWLKMGFSLAKAGKAVIDIGMGNPLGLITTGVECVKGIYDAYKTNDDDEFNTYITQPFLTSTEQDQLLEKLRDQGFFEKLAYDNQAPGWYLLNPEEDGVAPAGEQGSVTKVWKKDGYGIGEAIASGASVLAGELGVDGIASVVVETGANAVGSGVDHVQGKMEMRKAKSKGGDVGSEVELLPKSPLAGKSPTTAGSRAAAMRHQLSSAGSLDSNSLEAKTQSNNMLVDLQHRVDALEGKNAKLEKRLQEMDAAIAKNANGGGGSCCVVS